MRSTQQEYAMKIMNKWDMLRRGEVHRQCFVARCDHHYVAMCLSAFTQLCLCHTDCMLPGGEGGSTEGGQMLDHRAALRLSGWQLSGAYEWTQPVLVCSVMMYLTEIPPPASSLSTWWWITMSGGTCWPCSVSLETGSLKTWLSSTWLRWSWPLTLSTDWVTYTGRYYHTKMEREDSELSNDARIVFVLQILSKIHQKYILNKRPLNFRLCIICFCC